MGKVIAIASGKGGVGKTITAANISIGLAQLNKKVIIIDANLGLRNLDIILGVQNKVVYDFVDVVTNKCKKEDAFIVDKRYQNLTILPASWGKDQSAVTKKQMDLLINDLREEYDFVIIDCPNGMEQGFQNAVGQADHAIIITTLELSSVRNTDRIFKVLEAKKIKKIDLLVNRVLSKIVPYDEMISIEELGEILPLTILGMIPEDEKIMQSVNQGEPIINTESKAGQAYINISKRILGEDIPFLELSLDTGILSKLTQFFRRK